MDNSSEIVNTIILECIDAALERVAPQNKQALYEEFTRSFNSTVEEIPNYYGEFLDIIKKNLTRKQYHQIVRLIVRILHERATAGNYKETHAIEAFGKVVDVNLQKTEERLRESQQIYANAKTEQLKKIISEQSLKLKQADRLSAIGQTAAMVGHDIRNPLQSIVGEIYLAKEELALIPDSEPKNRLKENISLIEENLSYIDKIVSDLQDYTKPLRPEFTRLNIEDILANNLALLTIPSNVEVSINVEDDVPKLDLDPLLIKRVLSNLITNALQAMPKGGKLMLHAFKEDGKAVISIEDTGIGITEEAKAKLFTPMFTTKSKGQGFGLAVAKRLVEVQGGKISFRSEKGNGTAFALEFPLKGQPSV